MSIWQPQPEKRRVHHLFSGMWSLSSGVCQIFFAIVFFPFKLLLDLCIDIWELLYSFFTHAFNVTYSLFRAPFRILTRVLPRIPMWRHKKAGISLRREHSYLYTSPKKEGIFHALQKDIHVLRMFDKPFAHPQVWFQKKKSSVHKACEIFHFPAHEFPAFRAGRHFIWNEERSWLSHQFALLKTQVSKHIPIIHISLPNIALPRLSLSHINISSLKLPKITVPQFKLPVFKLPAFTLPSFKLPIVRLPKLVLPRLSLPTIRLPKFSLPKITLPRLKLPTFTLPKFTLPKFLSLRGNPPAGGDRGNPVSSNSAGIPRSTRNDIPNSIPDASYWKRIFEQKKKFILPHSVTSFFDRLFTPVQLPRVRHRNTCHPDRSGGIYDHIASMLPKFAVPSLKFPAFRVPKLPGALTKTYSLPTLRLPKFTLPRFVLPSFRLPVFTVPKLPRLLLPKLKFPIISFPRLTLHPILKKEIHLPKFTLPSLSSQAERSGVEGSRLSIIKHGIATVAKFIPSILKGLLRNDRKLKINLPKLKLPTFIVPKLPSALTKTYSFPTVKLPRLSLPTIRLPKFSLPKLVLPKFPSLSIPKITVPQFKLPVFKLPAFTLPSFKLPIVRLPKLVLPRISSPAIRLPKFSLPKLSLPKFVLPFLSFPWKLPIYSRVKQLIINRSPLGRESSEIKRFSNTWIPDRVGDDNPQKTSTAIPDASYWKRIFEQKEKLMAQTDALKNSFSLSQPVKNLFTHFKVIFNAYSKKLSSQQKGQPSKFFLFKKEQTAQILLLLLVVGTLGVFFTTLASTTNRTKPITYQGRLMDTNYVPVADANYQLKFRIYDALTGGNCKWATGTDTNANNCNTPGAVTTTVSRGFFSIDLGDNTTGNKYFPYDFSDATTYLEITIGSETTTPRRRITAAPYALNSEELGGIAASGFAQLSGATFTGNVTTTALVSSGAISGTTGTFSGLVKQTGSLSTVGAGTTESAYTYSLLRSGLTFTFGGEAFNKIDGAGINDTGFQFPLRYDGGAARANLIIDPSNDGANSYNLVWQVASSTMFSVSRLGAGLFAAGLTANTGTFSGLLKQTGSLSTVGAGTKEAALQYSLSRGGIIFTFGGEAFNKIDGAGINDTGFQFPLRYDGGAARANLIIDPSNDGANSYNLVWQVASSTMFSVSRLGAGLFAAGLTATTGTFSTSVSTPSIITASGALGITPAAGSGLNISLSTTGDFAVNTNQLYVDTSSGNVGIGTTTPADLLTLSGTGKFVRVDENSTGNSGIVVSLNSTNKGFFGVTGAANGFITGSAVGDVVLRIQSQKLLISTDGGTTANLIVGTTGNVGIGVTAPQTLLHLQNTSAKSGMMIGNSAYSTTTDIAILGLNYAANDWAATSSASDLILMSKAGQSLGFAVSNLSTTAQVVAMTLTSNAHIEYSATTTPTISDCGTSATITGTDMGGRIVIGTTPGTCTVTFKNSWTNAPLCWANNETTANLARASASATVLTIAGTLTASDNVTYGCVGWK